MEERTRQEEHKKQEKLKYASDVSNVTQLASQIEEDSRKALRDRRLAIDRENIMAMEQKKEQLRLEKLHEKVFIWVIFLYSLYPF